MSVVTISRQFGAGGKTLSEMVATALDYSFIDNEIIQMVATKAKVSTEWVESIEKEAGGKFQKFISGLVPKTLVERVLDEERGYIDEEIYVDLLHKIIAKIADEDRAVILGRGGQYILKDRPDTYHILLIAEKEDRVNFMEDKYKLSPAQAVHVIEGDERRRANLYRKFGKKNYDHPSHYHMVFNMSKLDFETACNMVIKLIRK